MLLRWIFVCLVSLFTSVALAEDVIVTRHFSGHWDQIEHESQGIILQVVNNPDGSKNAAAYWFTYASDMESSWLLGVGPVTGNRVEMTLFQASGVGFLEPNSAGDDNVETIGTLVMEFSSCNAGLVTFTTDSEFGSGSFAISRLTSIFNTNCSGGISDDTPSDSLLTDQRISLVPARAGINGSGHADFEQRPDRSEFSVEAEDIANGSYRIFVGGVDRGELVVSLGQGETEFRSPVEPGKILLTFDPRGETVEVHDAQGAILTSGEASFGDDGTHNGGDIDFGLGEIEVDLGNTGVFPQASGDAKLDARADRTDFSVEIEDVPAGSYDLRVGGTSVGTIQAAMDPDGTVRGENEYRVPVEPGKILLDFDPRGQAIQVFDDSTVILETQFPMM